VQIRALALPAAAYLASDTPVRVHDTPCWWRQGTAWSEPPAGWTPHADRSRRAPARTGALRAA